MATYEFASVRDHLDDPERYENIVNTPWYPGATYATFSPAEFARRHHVTQEKMARLGLDALIAPGGQHHWSWGGGLAWLSGHLNWHSMVEYVVIPREGDPTLIVTMGGAHIEATRRAVGIRDVRYSHRGRFADVAAQFLHERGLDAGRVGIAESDWYFHEYVPVNQYETLCDLLPLASVEFVPDFFHELVHIKSPEEQEFVAKAGELCVKALYAIRDRARPGVTEYQLKASAARAIMEGDGQVNFLIIGSTPMSNPAQVFGNPRPSHRILREGDIILNELAASYQGYTAQVGIPVCVGEPTTAVRHFFDDVVLPGFLAMQEKVKPGNDLDGIRAAGEYFRAHGAQSRPVLAHGIDFVTNSPHINTDGVHAFPYERTIQPGMVLMVEPCPITPDGLLGLFFGHTYIITENGARRVTDCPDDLLVAR